MILSALLVKEVESVRKFVLALLEHMMITLQFYASNALFSARNVVVNTIVLLAQIIYLDL